MFDLDKIKKFAPPKDAKYSKGMTPAEAARCIVGAAKAVEEVKFIGQSSKVIQTEPAIVIEWPRTLMHRHTFGKLTPFFLALKEGRLLATRCINKECDEHRPWLPPRADCPDCNQPMEWVELPQPVIGQVYAFTQVAYPGTGIELSYPYWQIDVEILGLATIPKGYLIRGTPYIGMKVKAAFRKEGLSNTILDLCWEPLEQ